MFDASVRFIELCDPLTLFYSAWLNVDKKKEIESLLTSTLSKLKKESRLRIYGIILRLKNKRLTPAGRERKRSIVRQLFFNRDKCLLKANTLISLLPIFKSFILTFEQKEPLVHRLFDEVCAVFKTFLGCFFIS